MRLKTITVNGRTLSAQNSVVVTTKRDGTNPQPEVAFADMDKIVAAIEKDEKQRIDVFTMTTGYYPEFREAECGDGTGLVVAFGCWEVGDRDKFKSVYEQLKEINVDPEKKPLPGLVMTTGGYFLKVVDGTIYTCDEDGTVLERVISLEDAKMALTAMEYRQTLTIPKQPAGVRITGIGTDVVLQYACQSFLTAEVKSLLEGLSKPAAEPAAAS